MTDQERTKALHRLQELMRADEEIRLICNTVAMPHGGLPQLIAEEPEMFDLLVEEVDSILAQLGIEPEGL